MRLTVGQLPPSVYWRRRAVVIAGVLAVVLIVAYSCSGGDDPERKPTGSPSSTGQPASTQSQTATPPPSVISPNASDPSTGVPINPNGGGVAGATEPVGQTCADSELLVTAAAQTTSVRQGASVTLFIRIKNVSTRQCSRDLGAQSQELYLEQNSAKQWSSDDCTNNTSPAGVRQLGPGIEYEYNVSWAGQGTAQGCTNRQLLAQGTYQLRARLDKIVSEPVTVTVTA